MSSEKNQPNRDSEWAEYIKGRYSAVDSGSHYEEFQSLVRLDNPNGSRLLDIGTGPGNYLAALSVDPANFNLNGTDFSGKYIRSAKEELKRRNISASLTRSEGGALPYKSGSFNLVMSHLTLPYVDSDSLALSEMARLLQPGGVLWLTTHGSGFFWYRIVNQSFYFKMRWIGSLISGLLSMVTGWKPLKDTHVTPHWLKKRSEQFGLNVEYLQWSHYGIFPRIIKIVARKPPRA